MNGAKNEIAQGEPVEIGERQLGDVAGGYHSGGAFQILSAGKDIPVANGDGNMEVIVGADAGGGPHIR